MKRILPFLLALVLPVGADEGSLRQAYRESFFIGVALGHSHVSGVRPAETELVTRHFNSITPENDMKWQSLQPRPGQFDFSLADAYADFSAKHGMKLIGHTLVWHSQTPDWVFRGPDGGPATRELLLDRMRGHILRVVGRYRGKVHGWDVVNEALADGGAEALRDSPWRRIIGDDFLDHAFRFAHEADPQAELYYNDYNLEDPLKRERCEALIRGMLARGVPIHGVGTQSHFNLHYPSIDQVDETLRRFSALGIKVMVTELDVDVLPSHGPGGVADLSRKEKPGEGLDPYRAGLPDDIQQALARRYAELFRVYRKHEKSLTRVTFWGLHDGQSWLNQYPIGGRTNHPLLFDRELHPKPACHAVLEAAGR
ncbi:MAG: endo-1,4-beta-xylanase [Akkermansiaceae bacterium]|nr:endo-1,4-beta-xylanase [Akkermansiaceae bacterium]